MRCPNCGTNNPPEEQLTYCKKCGTELRIVCPRCSADNDGNAEYCGECGLELHPDRGHERAAGIRVDPDTTIIPDVFKKRPTLSAGMLAAGIGVLIVVWIPIFMTLKKRAQVTGCQSNLKNIVVAMQAYAQDNGGHVPTGYEWHTIMLPYLRDRNSLVCPSRPGHVGYAFNLNLSEAPLASLNNSGTVIAFFETGDEKNLSGSQSLWLKNPAHSRGNNLVFVDGTVRQSLVVPADQFWQPKVKAPVEPTTPPEHSSSSPINPESNPMSNPGGNSGGNPVANPAVNPLPPGATPTPPQTSVEMPMGAATAPQNPPSNPPPPGGPSTNPSPSGP